MRLGIGILLAVALTALAADWRNITTGWQIPREGYSDQPYVVITKDGGWLCVLTTGKGAEGDSGQHIVAAISADKGRTWGPLIDIESANGPEASWVMPLIVPSSRVYVFYTYNSNNIRLVPNTNNERVARRVDTLGKYCFKYSDDGGRTWSARRYDIPMRAMAIDRGNNFAGKELFFWGVGKPIVWRQSVIFGFAKVGRWGDPGTMVESQGCFLRSDNILTERDPGKIRWVLLPDGDSGLRAPKGPVSDEANLVALSNGALYATYRTIDGYNCHAYSRDGGHTWTPPEYATYTPAGRRIKHPRAANFVRRFSNGKYLLWFHNHGGEAVHNGKWEYYTGRNPAWVSGGIERDGKIWWSEPEILLYDENPQSRISYPDFIEDSGHFYVTETQKTLARVHEIDRSLLEGLWNQFDNRTRTRRGLVAERRGAGPFDMPKLPAAGFTIEMWVKFRTLSPGQVLLDARGLLLATTDRFTLELSMNDGVYEARWDSDPGTHAGTLKTGVWQHVTVVVDGGPRLILWVIDGVLNDGGALRDYGWGRYGRDFGEVKTALRADAAGDLRVMRIYDRPLRVSEVIGNYRAEMQ